MGLTARPTVADELNSAFDHFCSLGHESLLTERIENARAHLHLLAERDLSGLSAAELEDIADHLSPGWAHDSGLLAQVIRHSVRGANRLLLAAMIRHNWHGGKAGFQFLPDPAETDPDEYWSEACGLVELLEDGIDGDPRRILTEEDLAFFESLPERFTIYRGASKVSGEVASHGLCWTTRRPIAEWFATRSASQNGGSPVLISAQVYRAAVLFVKASEFEVVAQIGRWRELKCKARKSRPDPEEWRGMVGQDGMTG
jgi:hypothetical protein